MIRTLPFSIILLLIVLLAVMAATGCGERQVQHRNVANTQTNQAQDAGSSRQFVDQALNFLDNLDRFPIAKVQEEVLNGMNRWLSSQTFEPAWQPDAMIAELPEEIRQLPRLQNLASRKFLDRPEELTQFTFRGSEFDFLVGEYWAKVISSWIRQNKVPPADIQEFVRSEKNLSGTQADDLGLAWLLFDWTARHIHPVRPPEAEEGKFAPGTSRDFWNALQLNEGDALERARVFIHLCRQQGLEAVAVRFGDENPVTQVVGVAIGDELYLFDTAYALPIATANGTGIQRLSRLVENPDTLVAMNSGNYKYPVTPQHLRHVTLLIDAPSTSLTQATSLLEGILSGDAKLVLHVRPSLLRARLGSLAGVSEVKLWEVPFQAEQAIATRMSDSVLGPLFQVERWIYDTQTPFSQARTLQLLCRFDDEVQRVGARQMYLQARIMEREFRIALPRQRLEMLEAAGMDLPNDPQVQQFFLDRIEKNVLLWRELASFNLGVIALEAQEYRSAIDYFQKRTLDEFANTRFKSAAYYGIGRGYEALADLEDDAALAEQAREYYTNADDVLSPYRRGNALRAKRLLGDSASKSSVSESTQPTAPADEPANEPAAAEGEEAADKEVPR